MRKISATLRSQASMANVQMTNHPSGGPGSPSFTHKRVSAKRPQPAGSSVQPILSVWSASSESWSIPPVSCAEWCVRWSSQVPRLRGTTRAEQQREAPVQRQSWRSQELDALEQSERTSVSVSSLLRVAGRVVGGLRAGHIRRRDCSLLLDWCFAEVPTR